MAAVNRKSVDRESLMEYKEIDSEEKAILWHEKYTPWFHPTVNVRLGQAEWEKIKRKRMDLDAKDELREEREEEEKIDNN